MCKPLVVPALLQARRGAVKVQAAAKQIPHWLPGTPRKDYLDAADLPGNFSFDPLNLATNPTALTWCARKVDLYICIVCI